MDSAGQTLRALKSGRHSTSTAKMSSGLESTLFAIGNFLESFSGLAEIMKGADPRFGGLAYGTMMLLLKAVINKRQQEEAIEEGLEELTYALPRLDTLLRLRATKNLRTLVVDVFQLVIVFCRESILYCTNRVRRLKDSVRPERVKMKPLSQLRRKLAEIHKESEMILREDIDRMSKQLEHVKITGDDTNRVIRGTQAWLHTSDMEAENAYLNTLKRQLYSRTSGSPMTLVTVAEYKRVLHNEFSSHKRSPRTMSWALLEEQKSFSDWYTSPKSSLLILGGINLVDDTAIQLNWVSGASTLLIERPQESKNLFFLCQTTYTVPRRQRRSFSDVIDSLIYQLVQGYPQQLHHLHHDIADVLASDKWHDQSWDAMVEIKFELLTRLLAALDNGAGLTFIIDRLDQCRWGDVSDDESMALDKAIAQLLEVAEDKTLAHLHLKVFLVMDEGSAQELGKQFSWAVKRGTLYCKSDWQQEREDE